MEQDGALLNPAQGSISDVMVELAEGLTNPEAAARLGRALEAVAGLKPKRRAVMVPPRPARPRQGQVLRAIKTVLADQPAGLRTVEVWRLVEARLGRPVSYSAIKNDLATNVGLGGCFERPRRGVYRVLDAA